MFLIFSNISAKLLYLWYNMKALWVKYENQLQFGLAFARHKHHSDADYHYHIFLDVGVYCLEILIGEE